MAPAKLELRGLAKRFGEVAAVDGVSLAVGAGESVVLLGPSGCGKTTTLRVVAGFLRPDGGEVLIDGARVASAEGALPPEKRGVGMVFQNYAVWPHKTVAANIAFGLRLKGLPRGEVERRVGRALALVQMAGLGGRYPAELSGGQQQRVALARALVVEPTLLLLDEPLSNLDAALREEMRFEVKDLQGRLGLTMVYVTHDQQEAMVLADRVVVMNRGRVEQVGTPEEIYRSPRTRFVAGFVGLANLLEGEAAAVEGETVLVRTPLGAPCRVALPNGAGAGLAPGSRVGLVVRPEDIQVGAPAPAGDANTFRGRLLRRVFLGQAYDLRVRVGEVELRCMSPKGASPPPEDLTLRIPPGAWHVLEG